MPPEGISYGGDAMVPQMMPKGPGAPGFGRPAMPPSPSDGAPMSLPGRMVDTGPMTPPIAAPPGDQSGPPPGGPINVPDAGGRFKGGAPQPMPGAAAGGLGGLMGQPGGMQQGGDPNDLGGRLSALWGGRMQRGRQIP
jgi:hypothetical protein